VRELDEAHVAPNPFMEFKSWFEGAVAAGLREPEAMTLATATRDGKPSARMVLLKSFDERGFVFYTNYESRKGRELEDNPWAALILFWVNLGRQIRIEGRVERVDLAESDAYFHSRALGSQIAARASNQSQVLSSREELDRRVRELTDRFPGNPIPRPPYWGGYRVRPTVFEFWQGRPNRLHDRLRYCPTADGSWRIERLSP